MNIHVTYIYARESETNASVPEGISPTDVAENIARATIPDNAKLISVRWETEDKKTFGSRFF